MQARPDQREGKPLPFQNQYLITQALINLNMTNRRSNKVKA